MSIIDNARSEIANVEAAGKSLWSRIKPFVITSLISAVCSGVLTKCAFGAEPAQTQRLEGPGQWVITADGAVPLTAPQEQASALAVPEPAAPVPSSVIAVVLCNKLDALAMIDSEATIHPVNLEGASKADAMKIMQLVPADRVISINLGCPGDPSKDTTVL